MRSLPAIIVACLLAVPSPASAARPPEEVRHAVDRALDSAYQRTLPDGWEPAADAPAAKVRAAPARAPARDRPLGAAAAGAIATWLLWALIAVAGVITGLWLIVGLRGVPDPGEPAADGTAAADARAVIERPLGDAEALARRGAFGEAIHVLLLRTLQELARGLPTARAPSLTSREILARVDVSPDARAALHGLVLAVELSHFGKEHPGEDDYRRCLEHFHRCAGSYTRSGG
jgi:hypothetical protein